MRNGHGKPMGIYVPPLGVSGEIANARVDMGSNDFKANWRPPQCWQITSCWTSALKKRFETSPPKKQMEKVPKRRILYTMVSQHSHEKSTIWMVFTRGIFNSELFVYRRVFQMNHFQLYLRKSPFIEALLAKKWPFTKYLHKRSRVRVANHFWFQQIRHWNAADVPVTRLWFEISKQLVQIPFTSFSES